MAPIPSSEWTLLTPKTDQTVPTQNRQTDPIVDQIMTYYELGPYNGEVLKFTMEKFGTRPELGYAVYIALHGGGGDVANQAADKGLADWRERSNNGVWHSMATNLYRSNFQGANTDKPNDGVGGAIYIAPRGIVNDWNLHFRPESYYLFEQLIVKLLQPAPKTLVDSNRIFVTGFSAGGDGAYRLAANLSDRFAAVNASSGHPGEVGFENFANLPFCSQVGEKDDTIGKAGERALAVVDASVNQLSRLEGDAVKNGTPGLYVHDCFLYTQGWNFDKGEREPADHNNWERAEDGTAWFTVVKKDKLSAWLQNKEVPDADLDWKNSNAIDWMRQYTVNEKMYPRERNPIPSRVVWNLASRPPGPVAKTGQPAPAWEPKRFFYWLYLKDSPSKTFDATTVIRASYNSVDRYVQIDQPNDYTVLLLNDKMFSLDKPITVYAGPKDSKTKGTTITVKQSEIIRQKTSQARGDKQLEFTAMIHFAKNTAGGGWEVKSADTLDPVSTIKSRL